MAPTPRSARTFTTGSNGVTEDKRPSLLEALPVLLQTKELNSLLEKWDKLSEERRKFIIQRTTETIVKIIVRRRDMRKMRSALAEYGLNEKDIKRIENIVRGLTTIAAYKAHSHLNQTKPPAS